MYAKEMLLNNDVVAQPIDFAIAAYVLQIKLDVAILEEKQSVFNTASYNNNRQLYCR